jgi:choloylglycine hydrolase
MINQRNLEKVALVDPSEKPMKWVSRFGSITFNQVGRELPYGGINEAGLVVEHMTLEKTVYPSKDERSAIGACQWIQFQLDNYATVEEVISSDSLLRISEAVSRFHFLVCDRFGHVATIEFLDGKMECHTGKNLPVPALANSTYEESLSCHKNNGDTQSDRSLYNFVTAARLVSQHDSLEKDSIIADAFRALNAVSQGLGTKWSIVYDITNMRIHLKVFETPTIVGEQKVFLKKPGEATTKIVDINGFDFNCTVTGKVLDLDSDKEGEVNPYFVNYSTGINKEFIYKAFTFFKGWGIGIELREDELNYLAAYPGSFNCLAGD